MTIENSTGDEKVTDAFGLPIEVQVSVSLAQAVIALIGILGNSTVIYAYQSKRNRVTSENLIITLAAIDAMCCGYWAVSNIIKVKYDQKLPLGLCIPDSFLQSFFTLISMQIMVLTAANRYVAVVYPLNYGTYFSSTLVSRVLCVILVTSTVQSALFSPMCLYVNNYLPQYEQQILLVSNFYWTISTSICYLLIIIAITALSFSTARNLKESVKTAEKLLRPSLDNSDIVPLSRVNSQRQVLSPMCSIDTNKSAEHENNSVQVQSKLSTASLDNHLRVKFCKGTTANSIEADDPSTSGWDPIESVSTSNTGNSARIKSKTIQRDLRLTKALLAVAVAYIICCTPYTVYVAGFRLMPQHVFIRIPPVVLMTSKFIGHTMYLFNYVINPFTYLIFNEYYRAQVSKLPLLSKFIKPDGGQGEPTEPHPRQQRIPSYSKMTLSPSPSCPKGVRRETLVYDLHGSQNV